MLKKIAATAFIFIFLLSEISAQVYFFKKYTTSDGLVQGTIRTICQDSKGRMWFGTAEGVSIYDGNEFYNYASAEGLVKPVITSFYEITDGIMLVGTLGGGIAVFSDPPYSKTILRTNILDSAFISGKYISQIIPDEKNNIWIVTDNGITKWEITDDKVSAIEKISALGQFWAQTIFQILFYDEKNFYAATETGLIKKTDSGYEKIKYKGQTIDNPVFALFKDSRGIIWFSTFEHLYYIENNIIHNAKEIHPILDKAIYCFAEDADKNILFGTIDGVIELSNGKITIINKANGLDVKDIFSLYFDAEKNLWIGSITGLNKLTGSSFKYVHHENFKGHFSSIVSLDKKLFVTSNEGIFGVEDYSLKKSELGNGIPTKIINHISKDQNGSYWFSTDIGVFSKNKNIIKHFSERDGLPHDFIYETLTDKNNVTWIATQGGLAYIKENNVYNFKEKFEKSWVFSDSLSRQILSTQSIRRLAVDVENSVWVGTWAGGLFKINGNSIHRFSQKDGLLDLSIRGIKIDAQKNIWVSTRYGGAFKFDGKSFVNYTTKNGLKSNWVFSVETDYNNNLWFCTANGLSKHDGYKWINYDPSDGITSAEIMMSIKYAGKLWFLSRSQIFSYEPDEKKNLFYHPAIFFKQIKLIDDDLPFDNSVKQNTNENINSILASTRKIPDVVILEHSQNSLVFEFVGIDFKDENKVSYEYILEGFEKEWTKNTRKNFLTYTHLPPGKYSFKAIAIDKEGIKSLSPAVFNFEILIPFWQSWWFITISLIFFVLIISFVNYLIYQYKIKQALRLERIRTKISTDLHDEIGTSLSSIAIFAELVKREISGRSPKVLDMLGRIQNTSRDLIENMSDIVWAINPGNDKFEDALLKLKDYTIKILESRDINVVFMTDKHNAEMATPMDVRRNLLLIFKEIVTNAAKYSKADQVKIDLRFEDKPKKKIFLSITDNGVGFDVDKIQPGYGLKNIKRRCEELQASLELNSSVGKGTSISIEINIE